MDKLNPQILLTFPENINMKEEALNNYLSFAFPNGIESSNNSKTPIIYSIVLTNEKGINFYLYVLLFYEKLEENDLNNSGIHTHKIESLLFPVSIIIISYYSNIDFFRKLLIEFYNIIKIDSSQINNNKENLTLNNLLNNKDDINKINSFQKMEFINYLHFCCELLRPPNNSILTLNMRFSSLEYKFNSLKEISNNDFCIDLLFNALEISVILKLFTALLFEKHIIIIANQNLPLFCIAESLKLLLFPLRWPHIYIPNLPYENIKYLESPTPYLMGINSPLIDLHNLIEKFPSNIICDVSTSTLYGNLSNLNLPLKEENRIKSKLLKLKGKYINNYDDIDYGIINNSFYSCSRKTNSLESSISTSNYSTSEGNDDIDYQISFGQNVQNIFFDLFKNNLANIKNECISGNIFNSHKFLNSFNDNEYKYFFEKLIKTLIFEDFLFSLQYSDDSFSRQYNNIINENTKNKNTNENRNKYYLYEFKTQKNIQENSLINQKNNVNIIKNYNEISDILEKGKNNKENNSNDSPDNIIFRKRCCNSFRQVKDNNNKICDIYRSTIKSIKDKKRHALLNFYGKNGFISFYQNYNYLFLYHKKIYKEIYQINEEISSSYSCNSKYKMIPIESPEKKKNKEENNYQEENEKLTDIPVNYSCQLFIIIGLYLLKNIIYENNNNIDETNSITSSELSLNNENENNNGEMKKEEKNLNINDEITNKNNKKIIINNTIIKLFIRAFKKNQYEFPRNIFYTILNNFSLEELKKIEKTNIKYIDKTIQYQIDNKEKKTYKSMVINIDSDIEESTEECQQLRKMHTHKISDDFDDIKLLEILNDNLQNKNTNLSLSIRDNEQKEKEEKKNFKKTKINVIDNNFNSIALTNFQKNNNEMANQYKNKLKSIKINFNSFPNIGDHNSHFYNINLFSDPLALSEKICLLIYNFLCNAKIENYNIKNYDINFFKDLAYSDEFEEIKNLIISLKNISLENLSEIPKNYYCFWLNIFNFLTIFSVVFKCEIISNNYEWYRFLKNSYFDIGNLVISLYEIETYILRGREISKRIYTNIVDNSQFRIKEIKRIDNNLINYGISLPTSSSPILRIYYPFNFIDSLKINAIEFFSRNINYNTKNRNLEFPEYSTWIDTSFEQNLNNYKTVLPKNIFNFLKNKLNIDLIKYDWKLTFVNFKNIQNN